MTVDVWPMPTTEIDLTIVADYEFGNRLPGQPVAYSFLIYSEEVMDLYLLNGAYLSITASAGTLQTEDGSLCYACINDTCDTGKKWDFTPSISKVEDKKLLLSINLQTDSRRPDTPTDTKNHWPSPT